MITREIRVNGKLQKLDCLPVADKCEGCAKVLEEDSSNYCKVYADPQSMWKEYDCIGATHVKHVIVSAAEAKVNPLKASKRASRGR